MDLSNLIILNAQGTDDSGGVLATLTPSQTEGLYLLSSLRILYTAGSTSATVTLNVDSHEGTAFDFELMSITGAGGGGSNINLGIDQSEMKEWYFRVDQYGS